MTINMIIKYANVISFIYKTQYSLFSAYNFLQCVCKLMCVYVCMYVCMYVGR